jgi:hypothetical protein
MSRRDWVAILIETAVVLTVIPRWVPALMLSEGFRIPETWVWWRSLSLVLNMGMAVTEAVAIAYIFNAWGQAHGRQAKTLLIFALITLATFILVLAPFIGSSVTGLELSEIMKVSALQEHWVSLLWGVLVAMTTAITVASVGYAQKVREQPGPPAVRCWCGEAVTDYGEHLEQHKREVARFDTAREALAHLKYGDEPGDIPRPTIREIMMWQERSRDDRLSED